MAHGLPCGCFSSGCSARAVPDPSGVERPIWRTPVLSQGLDSFLSPPAASRRAAWEGISWGSRASPDRSIQLPRVSNGGRGNGGDVGRAGCRWVGWWELGGCGAGKSPRQQLRFLPFSAPALGSGCVFGIAHPLPAWLRVRPALVLQ